MSAVKKTVSILLPKFQNKIILSNIKNKLTKAFKELY